MSAADLAANEKRLWDFSVPELNVPGEMLDFGALRGQVVLCINVASF